MGGTIARLVQQGHEVAMVDMTNGEPTPHGNPETRAIEAAAAADILGVSRIAVGLRNRFVEHTIEARHAVAGIIRQFQADVLFVPHPEDAHPDHRATTRIVEDARFDAKLTKIDLPGEPVYPTWLFHYYCTHLRIVPQPSFMMDITGHEQQKHDAITAYETQFVIPEGNRRVVQWLAAANTFYGSRIGTAAAEPFFAREPLGLTGLGDLSNLGGQASK